MGNAEIDPLNLPKGSGDPFRVIVAVHENSDPVLPFVHALCLATAAKGELEVVDVRKGTPDRTQLGIRRAFEQWRMLPAGSERSDVEKMGVKVKKIYKSGDARKEIAKRLKKHDHDLLVMGTEARTGLGHLFGLDLVENLANSQRQTTLYVPRRAKPFADPETGRLSLSKALVPVAEEPPAAPSLAMLRRIASFLEDHTPQV
ncbi:MAG: hypothetical protein GF418_11720, partial [Chitinivibrionales bacterium]|nr:hypothetical protein [Chitinivibrionales bacterium]MBD3396284.1 hypothetical protein [Chitinivibrionales bacterium]